MEAVANGIFGAVELELAGFESAGGLGDGDTDGDGSDDSGFIIESDTDHVAPTVVVIDFDDLRNDAGEHGTFS
jgi:hypothetical protein